MDFNVIIYNEIDSTNEEAKRIILKEANHEGTVIVSSYQSKGKGRQGRNFISEKNKGLYMSIILKPTIEIINVMQITLVSALVVKESLKDYIDKDIYIKWPNDIIVENKKICGILCETQIMEDDFHIIVGIGVNINQDNFEDEIKDKATSIYLQSGNNYAIEELCNSILKNYNEIYLKYIKNGFSIFLEEYKRGCITLNKEVEVIKKDKKLIGIAEDITENGELIVKNLSNEDIVIFTGEVSVRGINGYL